MRSDLCWCWFALVLLGLTLNSQAMAQEQVSPGVAKDSVKTRPYIGVKVSAVKTDSQAQQVGIQVGDILTQIDQVPLVTQYTVWPCLLYTSPSPRDA